MSLYIDNGNEISYNKRVNLFHSFGEHVPTSFNRLLALSNLIPLTSDPFLELGAFRLERPWRNSVVFVHFVEFFHLSFMALIEHAFSHFYQFDDVFLLEKLFKLLSRELCERISVKKT